MGLFKWHLMLANCCKLDAKGVVTKTDSQLWSTVDKPMQE